MKVRILIPYFLWLTVVHAQAFPCFQPNQESQTIVARFVEFSFGDAERYLFEDEGNQLWDFSGCFGDNCDFAISLPESQANEMNQGWRMNPHLLGKWFHLTHETRRQSAYLDGPMTDILIITEAIMLHTAHDETLNETDSVTGYVIYAEPMESSAYYILGVEVNPNEMVNIVALIDQFEGIDNFYELIDKEVAISYVVVDEKLVYDMRVVDNSTQQALDEVSVPNVPYDFTFSIIGRYVYTEESEYGTEIEIEGRDGTIHKLGTLLANDDLANVEVEFAVYEAAYWKAVTIHKRH